MTHRLPIIIAVILVAAGSNACKLRGDTAPPSPHTNPAAAIIQKTYPDYEIASECSGKFIDKNTNRALGLFDAKKKSAAFILTSGSEANPKLVVLGTGSAVETSEEVEVQCFTPKSARELNSVISDSEGIHGEIKTDGVHDTVCVRNPSDGTEVTCYMFDTQSSQFVEAGGWMT